MNETQRRRFGTHRTTTAWKKHRERFWRWRRIRFFENLAKCEVVVVHGGIDVVRK
jgi:hypothetical protein